LLCIIIVTNAGNDNEHPGGEGRDRKAFLIMEISPHYHRMLGKRVSIQLSFW
jgi:hypothetical protein